MQIIIASCTGFRFSAYTLKKKIFEVECSYCEATKRTARVKKKCIKVNRVSTVILYEIKNQIQKQTIIVSKQ